MGRMMGTEQALRPMRGFRVFADVLLDTDASVYRADVPAKEWQLLRPQERAALLLMQVLKDAEIDLCGTFHVGQLHRKVNPTTGEIAWKP